MRLAPSARAANSGLWMAVNHALYPDTPVAMLSWIRKSAIDSAVPVAEQIARLAGNGVRLRPGITAADVLALPERATLESAGYRATLCALGAERRDADGHAYFLSDDVWFFDSACINGPGDYAHVVSRLAAMLPDEFPARDADDSVLLGDWRASVSFEIGETRHHWTQRVMDVWLDETLLMRVNQFIDELGGAKAGARHLWQIPLESQHRLIVAATPAHGRSLAQQCSLALRNIV